MKEKLMKMTMNTLEDPPLQSLRKKNSPCVDVVVREPRYAADGLLIVSQPNRLPHHMAWLMCCWRSTRKKFARSKLQSKMVCV